MRSFKIQGFTKMINLERKNCLKRTKTSSKKVYVIKMKIIYFDSQKEGKEKSKISKPTQ